MSSILNAYPIRQAMYLINLSSINAYITLKWEEAIRAERYMECNCQTTESTLRIYHSVFIP